jgi:hypothetical protein
LKLRSVAFSARDKNEENSVTPEDENRQDFRLSLSFFAALSFNAAASIRSI